MPTRPNAKHVELTADEAKKLQEIAIREDKSMKEVLRGYVREGLKRDG